MRQVGPPPCISFISYYQLHDRAITKMIRSIYSIEEMNLSKHLTLLVQILYVTETLLPMYEKFHVY